MNRGGRPVQQNTQTQSQDADGTSHSSFSPAKHSGQKSPKSGNAKDKLAKISYVGFLAAITILLVGVLLLMGSTKNVASSEEDAVKANQFQAVFLNGGQVYFGKINDINSRYINMNNIYYLRVNQQVQPDQQNANAANDISLVKLGCELHGPEDSMVIYREQVIFWENLKSDGQVAKAVDEYVKANPKGQDCNQQNSGAGANTENNAPAATPPAANSKTPTAPAAPPANTKTR